MGSTTITSDLDYIDKYLNAFAQSHGPRLVSLNWEEEYKTDMVIKKGFVLKDKRSFDAKFERNKYGIHSPLFGTTWSDEDAFKERYSCECHKTIGRVFEGETCQFCGTKVSFIDVDLDIFGWISITNGFKLINPLLFKIIEKFIGEKVLDKIIDFKYELDIDGYYTKPPADANLTKEPFYGIGFVEFVRNFRTILDYYKGKKKTKLDLYNEIINKWDCIFTSKIPVYSSVLRPIFVSPEEYSYTNIERKYNAMINNINLLNEEDELNENNQKKINDILYKNQRRLVAVYDYIFETLNGKDGLIRDSILGGRINFSARNVIIPDPSLRAFQIKLPYLTFLELYKPEIINQLVKIEDISYSQAADKWFHAQLQFDKKVYEVMKYILKHTKYGCKVIINRNPTISFGSMLCMDIVDVKCSYTDLTMSLPIQILSSLNADFDQWSTRQAIA